VTMPLKVVVIGAGIAGLCTATSLRQAGHSVQVRKKNNYNVQFDSLCRSHFPRCISRSSKSPPSPPQQEQHWPWRPTELVYFLA